MGVSNDVFSVVLVKSNRHVEKFLSSCLVGVHHVSINVWIGRIATSVLAELKNSLNVIFFTNDVGVDSIHRHIVVVNTLLVKCIFVQLEVVTFENLILIQRE